MDWRARLGSKLVSLDTAVGHVGSGDTVAVAPFTTSPVTLCNGLIARGRKGGLENVRVEHLASLVSWTEPDGRRAADPQSVPPPAPGAAHDSLPKA